ncbi:MAG: DUF1302 family protein [Pseudomonadota bacterium]
MTRAARFVLLTALFVQPPASFAAEVDAMALRSVLSYGYGDSGSLNQGQLELDPSLSVSFGPDRLLVASARVRLDAHEALEPGRVPRDNYSRGSRPLELGNSGSMELRDFYLEFRSDRGLARFGKQQIVWGRLDGIKVLDVVNPQDFREFIIDDFADSRTSLWSAYFDYSFGSWRGELALVPDATGHTIPRAGAWFELTAPRFRFGAPTNSDSPAPVLETVQPGMGLSDTAVGLRLSRQFASAEFSAVAYSGIDPEPLGRLLTGSESPVIERFYERREVLGFSFDLGLGASVLRAEYAYQPDRVFNLRGATGLQTRELNQHRGALGLDLDGPLGAFINIQYVVDSIPNAPDTLVRPQTDRIGTVFIRRTFAYDALGLEARWYRSFTDDDDLVSLSADYAINDSTSVELAMQSFSGRASGLFGQFSQQDRVMVSLTHTF